MASGLKCSTTFALLLFVLVSFQQSRAQIHWNRGWGAGGSLGKRSPAVPFGQIFSKLWRKDSQNGLPPSHVAGPASAWQYRDMLPTATRLQHQAVVGRSGADKSLGAADYKAPEAIYNNKDDASNDGERNGQIKEDIEGRFDEEEEMEMTDDERRPLKDCFVDVQNISNLVAKLLEEETAKVLVCRKQRMMSWNSKE